MFALVVADRLTAVVVVVVVVVLVLVAVVMTQKAFLLGLDLLDC